MYSDNEKKRIQKYKKGKKLICLKQKKLWCVFGCGMLAENLTNAAFNFRQTEFENHGKRLKHFSLTN